MSRAPYTPLPTSSPGPASPAGDLYPSSPPPPSSRYPRPTRRTVFLLVSLSLALAVIAGALVHPEPIKTAVQKGKEAVASSGWNWDWDSASLAEGQGQNAGKELDVVEPVEQGGTDAEAQADSPEKAKADGPDVPEAPDDEVVWTRVGEDISKVGNEQDVDCSGVVRGLLSTPEFWKVESAFCSPLPRAMSPSADIGLHMVSPRSVTSHLSHLATRIPAVLPLLPLPSHLFGPPRLACSRRLPLAHRRPNCPLPPRTRSHCRARQLPLLDPLDSISASRVVRRRSLPRLWPLRRSRGGRSVRRRRPQVQRSQDCAG